MNTRELAKQIIAFLIPHLDDAPSRRSLVMCALGFGHPMTERIDYSGSPYAFAGHLLTVLDAYGRISEESREWAICAVLTELGSRLGVENQRIADDLCRRYALYRDATVDAGLFSASPRVAEADLDRRAPQMPQNEPGVSDMWYMAGTEGTGAYAVPLRTRRGRVGYRLLEAKCRIRVEPDPAGRVEIATLLTQSRGWKQPGDDGQNRFSTVVPVEGLPDTLRSAIQALNPGERGAIINPSAPDWVKRIVDEESQKPIRNQIFFSYSHKDRKWLDRLKQWLKPVIQSDMLWDDTKIVPGSKWKEEIRRALASAKVAVLLVSQDFLASDFIRNHELPPLLEAAEEQGLIVLWFAIGFSTYASTEIAQYQAAYSPDRPLNSLKGAKLDKALVEICNVIKNASGIQ